MRTVGRYELGEAIGHGGMAVVYLARQAGLDREVALKELRVLHAPDDPSLAQRFLREARVVGSLGHPNIVTVHEYFEHDGTPYIAMEYLRRGSLRPWVQHLSTAQVAGVLEGLLAALDHAESYSIVHRDLKPENLLVTDQGSVKVADFGIAKARSLSNATNLTAAGTTVGTPTYMAPEQAMAADVGPFTDLYSVGVMAYEMLAGEAPFADTDSPMAVMMRHSTTRSRRRTRSTRPSTRSCRGGSRRCWSRTPRSAPSPRPRPGTSSRRSSCGCSGTGGGGRRA